jgi:UDP-N-acetylglucosamine--N-acetylmuramyl-(pentapeptide) pyrophosphoryl-undecaprenol N-acetylglucosamine transferase
MARAARRLGEEGIDANLMVVGEPLEPEYEKYFNYSNVFNLGYIDWIRDLYKLVDLAVLTDDGMMIHEAMAFHLPVVALLGVKYGRYHNLAEVFKGAVLESNLQDLPAVVKSAFGELEDMKLKTEDYGRDILTSADKIADTIIQAAKE